MGLKRGQPDQETGSNRLRGLALRLRGRPEGVRPAILDALSPGPLMNKFLLIAALAAAAYFATARDSAPGGVNDAPVGVSAAEEGSDAAIRHAFANRLSNQQVAGEGTVVKTLPDDRNGSRHQRFIVRLASGHTLLVVHNIDLAPRVESLRPGDGVAFYGEYEWSAKGGIVHWTHHDPQGHHPGGWLRHDGRVYQ